MFPLYLHEFHLRLCGFWQVVMHAAVTVMSLPAKSLFAQFSWHKTHPLMMTFPAFPLSWQKISQMLLRQKMSPEIGIFTVNPQKHYITYYIHLLCMH